MRISFTSNAKLYNDTKRTIYSFIKDQCYYFSWIQFICIGKIISTPNDKDITYVLSGNRYKVPLCGYYNAHRRCIVLGPWAIFYYLDEIFSAIHVESPSYYTTMLK